MVFQKNSGKPFSSGHIAPVPMYQAVEKALEENELRSPGLVFERFFPCWQIDNQGNCNPVKPFQDNLGSFCNFYNSKAHRVHFQKYLDEIHARLSRLVSERGGRELRAEINEPLALGLGHDHPTGNGFCFDRNSGSFYLPATGIKGLCRAWAEKTGRENLFQELFGYIRDMEGRRGKVIVLDGYPRSWPVLKTDIINNHHPEFYREKPENRRYCIGEYPTPLDVESPVPVHHLSLDPAQDNEMIFRLLPVTPDDQEAVDDMARLLAQGLEYLGIGARTAAGYGTMRVREEDVPVSPTREEPEGPAMPGGIKTFISYSHADRDLVLKFLDQGSMMGVFPWLDTLDLAPMTGESLPELLKKVIRDRTVQTVTLFLSRNSRDAEWVKQEMQWAREMDKLVIPVLLDDDKKTRERLDQWLTPDNPLYLRHDKTGEAASWMQTILRKHQVDQADRVVIYLGHREGAAAPSPRILPDTWKEQYPVLVLGNGGYWQRPEQELRSWLPQSREEYGQFEQAIKTLLTSGLRAGHILVTGLAPLGIGGLVGKHWDRGTGKTLATWNRYEQKEWSVEGDPGSGAPDDWQILEQQQEITDLEKGPNLMLGHFAKQEQFEEACDWLRKQGGDLGVNKAVMFRYPQNITQDTASQLAVECAQSFGWARRQYRPERIYWFTGLPLAMMPLVTYLARAAARITFMDCDLPTRTYIPAFDLE